MCRICEEAEKIIHHMNDFCVPDSTRREDILNENRDGVDWIGKMTEIVKLTKRPKGFKINDLTIPSRRTHVSNQLVGHHREGLAGNYRVITNIIFPLINFRVTIEINN